MSVQFRLQFNSDLLATMFTSSLDITRNIFTGFREAGETVNKSSFPGAKVCSVTTANTFHCVLFWKEGMPYKLISQAIRLKTQGNA